MTIKRLREKTNKEDKMNAHIDNFIVKGNDFFVAYLDSGFIRVGMVAERSVDIPPGHAFFDIASCVSNEEGAEDVFDSLVEAGLICL